MTAPPSMRESFEAWWRTYWLTDMDMYARVQKESSWEAWQASAASMAERAAKDERDRCARLHEDEAKSCLERSKHAKTDKELWALRQRAANHEHYAEVIRNPVEKIRSLKP